MQFLYLDESGDLGFDFSKKRTSKFFVITILYIKSINDEKRIITNLKKIIKRKVNNKKKIKISELKDIKSLELKKYIFNKIKDLDFEIYSFSLNKKNLPNNIIDICNYSKKFIYDLLSYKLLEEVVNNINQDEQIEFIIDKSKNKKEILDFNKRISELFIGNNHYFCHKDSKESVILQLCDLCANAIFHKNENNNNVFEFFEEKVVYDKKISLFICPINNTPMVKVNDFYNNLI